MKNKLFNTVIIGSLLLLCSMGELQKRPLHVFIVGDSTASQKSTAVFPETGWGMELSSFFTDQVKVDNRAMNGRSTRSFINEGRWSAVCIDLRENDVVLIQFGHNDQKVDKPGIGTSKEEYRQYLVRYVEDTRRHKALPVLLTPIMRRSFKDGRMIDTHQGYPEVMKLVADSLQVPLIDLHLETAQLFTNLGESSSKQLFNHVDSGHVNYPKGKQDDTHLSPEGAKQIAQLVIKGLQAIHSQAVAHLIRKQ